MNAPQGSAGKYIATLKKNDARASKELERHFERLRNGTKLTPEMSKKHVDFEGIKYLRLHKGSGHRIYYFQNGDDYVFTHGASKGDTEGTKYKMQGQRADTIRTKYLESRSKDQNENS